MLACPLRVCLVERQLAVLTGRDDAVRRPARRLGDCGEEYRLQRAGRVVGRAVGRVEGCEAILIWEADRGAKGDELDRELNAAAECCVMKRRVGGLELLRVKLQVVLCQQLQQLANGKVLTA